MRSLSKFIQHEQMLKLTTTCSGNAAYIFLKSDGVFLNRATINHDRGSATIGFFLLALMSNPLRKGRKLKYTNTQTESVGPLSLFLS